MPKAAPFLNLAAPNHSVIAESQVCPLPKAAYNLLSKEITPKVRLRNEEEASHYFGSG
jgi:hypothetical protein